MGKLILVGAGPGDPELITVKGLKAVKSADVILYDALIDKKILEEAKDGAEKIFVGKRGYDKSTSQDNINKMCVKYVQQDKVVVRLKGGDPYIFARGHEEVEYAASFNLDSEVIPGLSSSTSLATIQGVPLTLRGITGGFSVISAVNKEGELTEELKNTVRNTMTVVILMGFKRLAEICDLYRSVEKKTTPIMIIENGSMENEKSVIGTIESIEGLAQKNEMAPPAIIIIGDVINFKIGNKGF